MGPKMLEKQQQSNYWYSVVVSLILCAKGNQSTLSPKKIADVEYTALKSEKEQFKIYLATDELGKSNCRSTLRKTKRKK